MKTYAFPVTSVEKEAIYTALCRATAKEYNESVYTLEILNILESPAHVLDLTLDQLGAAFRSLERAKTEPALGGPERFEQAHRSLKLKSLTYKITY